MGAAYRISTIYPFSAQINGRRATCNLYPHFYCSGDFVTIKKCDRLTKVFRIDLDNPQFYPGFSVNNFLYASGKDGKTLMDLKNGDWLYEVTNRLSDLLKEHGKSPEWLASQIDQDLSDILQWCNPYSTSEPGINAIHKIADCLRIDPDKIFIE